MVYHGIKSRTETSKVAEVNEKKVSRLIRKPLRLGA